MWNAANQEQFREIIADLLEDEDVLSMADLPQHSKTSNCLDHSLYVAYLSFLLCRRLGLDYKAAARAGLLHDFALCNWSTGEHGLSRLWQHPKMALKNAEERYDLSSKEKDIIVKHMWPLTPQMPRHLESFIVSMADKFCAVMEMSRMYVKMDVKNKLDMEPAAVPEGT